jgi:hypothetical protein
MLTYDADVAPVRASWLGAEEALRLSAVHAHHKTLRSHPPMPNVKMHVLMHVVVENQLLAGDPPLARPTIERLVTEGASRHAAIHAIASVVAAELSSVLKHHTLYDRDAAAEALARLRAQDWMWR